MSAHVRRRRNAAEIAESVNGVPSFLRNRSSPLSFECPLQRFATYAFSVSLKLTLNGTMRVLKNFVFLMWSRH